MAGRGRGVLPISLSVLWLKWLSIVVALARVLVFSLWILRFVFVSAC